MEILNREELLLISLQLNVSDILKWSRVNKVINKKVCKSDDIWRRLVLRDYPDFTFENAPNNTLKISPRDIYTLLFTIKVWNVNGNVNELYSVEEFTNNTTNVKIIPANLYLPKLCILNLHNNSVNYIPDNLNFPNLRELYLSYNDLKLIPMHIKFPNLKMLGLAHNSIICVPRNLDLVYPNLERLDLYGNRIEWIPENLSMPNLKWLRFNIFDQIENLPIFRKNNPFVEIDLI